MTDKLIELGFAAAGTSQPAAVELLQSLKLSHGTDPFVIYLVRDPDNAYDPNAVKVIIPTAIGRRALAHVPSRRHCQQCDPIRSGRGHLSYGERAALTCPTCGQRLVKGHAEYLSANMDRTDIAIHATGRVIGGEFGKENLGLWVTVTISRA